MLDQASADHPPNICNDAETLDLRVAFEVSDRKVGSSSVGASENVENLNGTGVQHGLESLKGERDAVAGNPWDWSALVSFALLMIGEELTQAHG